MTSNDLELPFHDKMRFSPALLESERLNVRNSTTSSILRCSVHVTIYLYIYSYRWETARQLRSAHVCAADALFLCGSWASCCEQLFVSWWAQILERHCTPKLEHKQNLHFT